MILGYIAGRPLGLKAPESVARVELNTHIVGRPVGLKKDYPY